eukprot:m.190408 g.190408  ORF g.190408 m.190408 type:complete len:1384 (+) comp18230_c0_seq2:259-4410(+)
MPSIVSPLKKRSTVRRQQPENPACCPADLGVVSNCTAYESQSHRAQRRKELGDEFFTEMHAIPTSVALAKGKWLLKLPKQPASRLRKDTMSLDEQEQRLRKDAGDAYTSLLQAAAKTRIWETNDLVTQQDLEQCLQESFGFSDAEHSARKLQADVSASVLDIKAQLGAVITSVDGLQEPWPGARVYCAVQLVDLFEIDKKERLKPLAQPVLRSAQYLTPTLKASDTLAWRDRFEFSVANWVTGGLVIEVKVEELALDAGSGEASVAASASAAASSDSSREPSPTKGQGKQRGRKLRLPKWKKRAKARRISLLSSQGDKVLGRVSVACRDMTPGAVNLTLEFPVGGKDSDEQGTINLQLFVHPVAVREQVTAAARAQHRTAQHYLFRHECSVQCGESADRMWIISHGSKAYGLSQVLPAPALLLLSASADYLKISPIQTAVDSFCAVVELNEQEPISASVLLASLKPVAGMLMAGALLDDEDEVRLVAAVECAVSWGMVIVSKPFEDIESSSPAELAVLVELLLVCYSIRPWKQATLKKQSEEHCPLQEFEMPPVLTSAVSIIDKSIAAGTPVTYIVLKAQLLAEFGAEKFEEHRREVSSLLAQKIEDKPPDSQAPIFERLAELLDRSRQTEELTYNSVKAVLSREFGPSAFKANKKAISAALINEMNVRRQMSSAPDDDRSFKEDLFKALETYVAQRYQNMLKMAAPEQAFEGDSIVVMVKTTTHICRDMENVVKYLDFPFSQIPGLPRAFVMFASWYEKLYVSDLRELLHGWSKKPNLPTVVFELYFATRQLLGTLTKYMRSHELHELRIASFCQFFEPFVCRWIELSQEHGERWISNSLKLDKWEPLRAEDMYSTSVLDVFRALFEILEFWQKLDWPDEEASDELLFGKLAECVCHCVQFYVEQLKQSLDQNEFFAAPLPSVSQPSRKGPAPQPMYLPRPVCVGINNLNHAELQLRDVFAFMRVNDVAQSHEQRAEQFVGDKKGYFKPHSSLNRFGSTFAFLSESIRETLGVAARRLAVQSMLVIPTVISSQHPLDRAIVPLIGASEAADGYLYRNLQCLVDHLQYDYASHQMVMFIWREIVVEMRRFVIDNGPRPTHEYGMLTQVLERLYNFFHADGEGLEEEELETGGYTRLVEVLRAACMTTPDLIAHFFVEAASLHAHTFLGKRVRPSSSNDEGPRLSVVSGDGTQDDAAVMRALGSSRGALKVRLTRTSDALGVDVISATGLPACAGRFEVPTAFVKLKLQPHHVVNAPRFYTDSHKSSNPVFNKTYKFSGVTSLDGLVLQCVVAHKQTVKRKLVIGEVLIDLQGLFLIQAGNDVTLTMPLRSFDFTGYLADIQTLLVGRSKLDKEASVFASKRMLTAPLARLLARHQVSEKEIDV